MPRIKAEPKQTSKKRNDRITGDALGDTVILLCARGEKSMRTLLEELWYGNVNPQEQSTENNREIKNLLNLMGKNRDNLSDTLTEEQKETLAKYDDCVNEMYGIIEREIFAYGFRLGGRLMLETLTGLDFE